MFDCGEGTQTQLMKSSVRPGRLNKIFITHLHGDHLFGLPGLLCTISQCANDSSSPSTINIYGPHGLRKFLRTAMHLSRSLLGFQYSVHELLADVHPAAFDGLEGWNPDYAASEPLHPQEVLGTDIKPNAQGFWDVCQEGSFRVHAGMLTHRIVCFGYVVVEDSLPGRLCVEKLKALGVPPGPLYARLKKGESITTPGGVTVDPADVVSPSRPGRKIVVLGDTCESGHIVPLAMNADVVVHESTNQNCDGQKWREMVTLRLLWQPNFASLCQQASSSLHTSVRDTGTVGQYWMQMRRVLTFSWRRRGLPWAAQMLRLQKT
eukprot:Em0016g370a